MSSIQEKIRRRAKEIENIIYGYLPPADDRQQTVVLAMDYTLKAGGKRLRPMLMEETYRMFGGERREDIEPFMAAIEMIHTYSLIHDDLPALDNDDTRRGKPTAHVVFGEDMAILAGDALLNYAFETASKAFSGTEADIRIAKAMKLLASKPGIDGMIGGQVVDVENTGKPIDYETLMYIHEKKTAALIECAMMIGAVLAGAAEPDVSAVEQVGRKIGLAFQIQDDILDVTSTPEILGKPVGSDEKNEKTTYVTFRGLSGAREDVKKYTQEALAVFDGLPVQNDFLREILVMLSARSR